MFKNNKKLIGTILTGIMAFSFVFEVIIPQIGKAEPITEIPLDSTLVKIQDNSLKAISNPYQPKTVQTLKMVITAYSSTVWQTDEDPFITASGSLVKEGIVANNLLPFGTKVKIPEIYGDKIFVVEDRMNARKGSYHLDIWFPDYYQAKDFGAKRAYIEVLAN
jgi:3D (Asp-Asp-Asp) domain-containing protein